MAKERLLLRILWAWCVSVCKILITKSAHREYSSVNDINDNSSVDLKQGFVTRWENVLITSRNIGTCVKITSNYFFEL